MDPSLADNFAYADGTLSVLMLVELALALMLPAIAAAFAQRWCMADVRRWPWVGPIIVASVLLAGALGASALPAGGRQFLCERLHTDPAWLPSAVCFAALTMGVVAMLLVSTAWWDRYYVAGRRDGFRAAALMAPIGLVCAAAAWLVLAVSSRRHETLVAAGSTSVPLAAMLALIGLNSGGLARAFANRGLDRWASLGVCVVPTLVMGATQYALLTLAFSRWGVEWSDLQPLAGDAGEARDSIQLLGRVTLGHAMLVTLLAVGGWIGIRAAPRPMIHRQRVHSADQASFGVATTQLRDAQPPPSTPDSSPPIDASI